MSGRSTLWPILSLAALIAIWQAAALIIASPTLPGPPETLQAMQDSRLS